MSGWLTLKRERDGECNGEWAGERDIAGAGECDITAGECDITAGECDSTGAGGRHIWPGLGRRDSRAGDW